MPVTDDPRRVTTTPAAWRSALLALLLVFALSPATARSATPPADFVGLGNWSIPSTPQSETLGSAGLRAWRVGLVWNWVEPTQGTRSWGYLDQTVADGARNGYDVLMVLNGCAQWACGATRTAPAQEPQLSQYRQFVAAAVQRYGRGGAFWTANPTLTPRPVSWQVWNEVNTGQDWPNPSPATYAPFLRAISETIKSIDPAATVVTSGLTEYPAVSSGMTGVRFLDELYDQPGFRESFDVLAIHGYAESPLGVVRILDSARRTAAQNGDANRRLWLTELGWSSGGPAHPFTGDEAGQKRLLQQGLDTLVACRARWNLERAYWFSLNDIGGTALGEADYWGHHTGLWRTDATAKPAWSAFAEYLGQRPLPGGRADTCPLDGGTELDLRDPDTTIGQAPVVVGARTRANVYFGASRQARFECALNGAAWTPCRSPLNVSSKREGGHELVVRAIDDGGVVDATPARVAWIVDLTPPDTKLVRKPPAVSARSAVRMRFTGSDATGVVGYQCRQLGRKWKSCKSGAVHRVNGLGLRKLQVRAIDRAGNVDPAPAQASVRVSLSCLREAAHGLKRGPGCH